MCRGVEQPGQLGWLITNRSQVQILPPQPRKMPYPSWVGYFSLGLAATGFGSVTARKACVVAASCSAVQL